MISNNVHHVRTGWNYNYSIIYVHSNVVVLRFLECCLTECHYPERRYPESHYPEAAVSSNAIDPNVITQNVLLSRIQLIQTTLPRMSSPEFHYPERHNPVFTLLPWTLSCTSIPRTLYHTRTVQFVMLYRVALGACYCSVILPSFFASILCSTA